MAIPLPFPFRRTRAHPALALIGAPFGLGAGVPGTEHGPAALRAALAGRDLAGRDLAGPVEDWGDVGPARLDPDVPLPPAAAACRHAAAVAAWVKAVRSQTLTAFRAGRLPVLLGGDHSMSMGSVGAAATHAATTGRQLAVLWIDAHADYNDPATSPSGNLHGMSLAHLCGAPTLAWLGGLAPGTPALNPARLCIVGARSVDPGEAARLAADNVLVLDRTRWRRVRAWLDGLDPARTLLHVSFDIDSVDPALAPGVGTPVADGFGLAEATSLLEMAGAHPALGALDVVEVNPLQDPGGRTARRAARLAAALLRSARRPRLKRAA